MSPTKDRHRMPHPCLQTKLIGGAVDRWSSDALAAASGDPTERIALYADLGLLRRAVDGKYDEDSLHRIGLIRFARERGVEEHRLAQAVAEQGDLLSVFDYLSSATPTEWTRMQAASEAGLDAELIAALIELLGWDPHERATDEDIAAFDLLTQALTLGLPREPLLQLVRVYADILDRLADAEVRTFHNYVHEQFRASGLSGSELLEATQSLGKPLLDLVEPAIIYFHRRAFER